MFWLFATTISYTSLYHICRLICINFQLLNLTTLCLQMNVSKLKARWVDFINLGEYNSKSIPKNDDIVQILNLFINQYYIPDNEGLWRTEQCWVKISDKIQVSADKTRPPHQPKLCYLTEFLSGKYIKYLKHFFSHLLRLCSKKKKSGCSNINNYVIHTRKFRVQKYVDCVWFMLVLVDFMEYLHCTGHIMPRKHLKVENV